MPNASPNNDLQSHRRPRVAVLGATLGTGNLGVDALGMSMVQGLADSIPNVEVVYQCWDLRLPVQIPAGETIVECEPMAIRRKNSLRHRDGLVQIRRMAKLRNWLSTRAMPQLPTVSRALKQLLSCDAILDVSAGDSFANIYGDDVFWYQTQLKLLCLELGLPLVLMPQTYGPFADEESERIAENILSRATLVCSREEQGIEEVQQLCGEQPPQRIIRVPDMAFLLEPTKTALPKPMQQALEQGKPCIAINVSGLLYFARQSFGLREDYKQFNSQLLQWALKIPESHVLLVPHVVAPTFYSGVKNPNRTIIDTTDPAACKDLLSKLNKSQAARVSILQDVDNPSAAKYAMSLCDYFIGARMHAFIGASSQCVPSSLLAYSKKAAGLANLLGIGGSVVDLRTDTIADCLAKIETQYQDRVRTKEHLETKVPAAKDEIRRFFTDEIAPIVLGTGSRRHAESLTTHHESRATREKKVLS